MPRTPFPISGSVTDIDGNTAISAVVIIYNLNNGDSIQTKTDSSGAYVLDTTNATREWVEDEKILIRAYIIGSVYRMTEIIDTIKGSSITKNLTLNHSLPKHTKDIDESQVNIIEHDPINNAKKVFIDEYKVNDFDDDGVDANPNYFGFERLDGRWYIMKEDKSTNPITYRYAKGSGDYTTNWSGRTSLTYGHYGDVF